jgi:hypothetical protein
MDTQGAIGFISGWLNNHIKDQNYFSTPSDHDRKLEFIKAEKGADEKTIQITFKVGRVWNVADPAIRRAARSCCEQMTTAKKDLADFNLERLFVQE